MNVSPRSSIESSWLAVASRPEIVRRSLRIATVVGTVLVAINYTDRLLSGTLVALDWIKVGLTYCVPYCVSTYSAVEAIRAPR